MCIVWCITCGEDGDPIGSFLPVKKVIYSWKPARNNKGSTFVTHNEWFNICVASLLKNVKSFSEVPKNDVIETNFFSSKAKITEEGEEEGQSQKPPLRFLTRKGGFLSPRAFLPSVNHIQSSPSLPTTLPINYQPSIHKGGLGQSCFNSNWHRGSVKMSQLKLGVPTCQGDFTPDIWAAKCTARGRGTHFHECGACPSKPTPPSSKSRTKEDGHRLKGELMTQRYSSSKAEAQRRMCSAERQEVWGRWGGWKAA